MTDLDAHRLAAWRSIRRTATHVIATVSSELERLAGMPIEWYETLLFLYERDEPVLRQELDARVALSASGISRMIAKMVAAGLIDQRTAEHDRRNLLIAATSSGRDALLRVTPIYHRLVHEHFGAWVTEPGADAIQSALQAVPVAGVSPQEAGLESLVSFGESVLSLSSDSIAVHDALVIREAIEILVLLDASARLTPDGVTALQQTIGKMAAHTDDPEAFYRADWQLHKIIASYCGNAMLKDLYLRLLDVIESRVKEVVPTTDLPGYLAERLAIHGQLVDAMASGDEARIREAETRHRFMRETDVLSAAGSL